MSSEQKNEQKSEPIPARDYAEGFVETREFNTYVDEAYWERNFSTDVCLDWMLDRAKQEQIELTHVEDFDYDTFFYNAYQCTEKGLS